MNLQNPTLFREQALIDNEWHSARSDDTIDVFNPFNHQKIGTIPDLSADDVRGAIATATTAQHAWSEKNRL